MKYCFLILLFSLTGQCVFGQKQTIDSVAYVKWPTIDGVPTISNDGKYVIYGSKNDIDLNSYKLVLQSVQTNWKMELAKEKGIWAEITEDSKYCLFINQRETLTIVNLKDRSAKYISKVSNFFIPKSVEGDWFAYQLNDTCKTLIIQNLRTGKEMKFLNVSFYRMSNDGKTIVIQRSHEKESNNNCFADWVNLVNGKITSVYTGNEAKDLVVDVKHQQLAFKVGDSICYYKIGMLKPVFLVKLGVLDKGFTYGRLKKFSEAGDCLYLDVEKKNLFQEMPKNSGVEVWSYTDTKLKSEQRNEGTRKNSYKAVIGLNDHTFIISQKYENEKFVTDEDEGMLVSHHQLPYGSSEGWVASKISFDLVNSKTGERKDLDSLSSNPYLQSNAGRIKLSPERKYIIYYDHIKKDYFSYDILSEKTVNLTKRLRVSWTSLSLNDLVNPVERGIAGWLPKDEAVLIYDYYDIWQFDPAGKKPPVNLTNGYGQKHQIIFNLALPGLFKTNKIVKRDEKLILSSFNSLNKNNGFFSIRMNNVSEPKELIMGSYIFKTNSSNTFSGALDFTPIKAKNAEVYVVRRMSSKDAPNYFITKDFKSFKSLTDFQPQKKYNWYKTELHNWKSLDGRNLQGILYKPENFDTNKRYPVIFYYYEKLSDGLNAYLVPEISSGSIDIPTYVSNGYLVFCPDIHYKVGDPMQGTYNAVVSAAEYISKLSFVDSKKIGLQGHSFGAIQTNYLVTQTNLFAAACSASGLGDWISGYGSLTFSGYSLQGMYENGQNRIGSTLWGNLNRYIKSSPVLQADKVTTPLLLEHGKKDGICPFSNEMEFFLGLRRLGKKVWMLVYPEAYHTLDGKDAEDFTLRMQQFFDHYLKDKPAPIWMLDGLSANDRGIGSGLDLDSSGRTPGPGLLTPTEQHKVESLMTRKPVTIVLK